MMVFPVLDAHLGLALSTMIGLLLLVTKGWVGEWMDG